MSSLRINLLGGFEAHRASGVAVSLPTKKTQALLAYLALHPGQAHGREGLASLLWGDTDGAHARKSLRQAVYSLRKALPPGRPPILVLEHETVALNAAAIDVDVVELERLVTKATPDALEQAATLYRGDLLHGFTLDEAPFEDWLFAERERLRELALSALAKLLAAQSTSGATEPAIRTAVRLLALDPLQEIVHRTLMRLYARQGRRGAALRQYQICVGVLQRELGAEPETETKQLYQEILQRRSVEAQKTGARPAARARSSPSGAAAELEFAATLPPEPTPIGRDAELGRLRAALDQAACGHGRVVIVLGEAGIGKTSVLRALAVEAQEQGGRVLLGRSYASEQILPFAPWVDAFRSGQVLLDKALMESLPPVWRSELTRLFPEVEAPGLPLPSDDQRRLFESVARLVEHLAARHPLILLLEDLHWADEMSLRLLSFIARRLQTSPVLLVATAREEDIAEAPALGRALQELGRERHVAELLLSPLSRAEVASLVRSLMKMGSEPAALAQLDEKVWTASEGNPFVAAEIVRALQEGTMPHVSASLPLPQRVREVVGGRLKRLSDRAHRLGAVAAVIGREFEFALLQRAAGLDEPEAAEGVEELVRRRVLHGIGDRFDFTHDRIREVAYTEILPPRRRFLHGAVGRALEALYAPDLEPHYAALGLHYREGEVWDKAFSCLRHAGASAAARSASREAVACFEGALAALEHLPESPDTLARSVDLRFDLQSALVPLGELDRIMGHLREAETLAEALCDQRRLARASAHLTHCLWWMGDPHRAVEAGRRGYASASAIRDLSLQVATNIRLGQAYFSMADYRRAVEILTWNARALKGELDLERFGMPALPAVAGRVWMGWCLAHLGDFAAAIAAEREGARLAEAANHPYSLALAYYGIGGTHLIHGDLVEATVWLERSLDLCQEGSFAFLVPRVTGELGRAQALGGRPDQALELLTEAAAQAAAMNFMAVHPANVTFLAEAYLLAGRAADATETAQRALALTRVHRERGVEADVLRILGACQPTDTFYRAALAIAEELGMRPLVAHCYLGLGELHRRVDKATEARADLNAAIALYREMDMTSWLARADAALALVG